MNYFFVSIYLSVCLSVCLSFFVPLFVRCIFLLLSFFHSIYLSLSLFFHPTSILLSASFSCTSLILHLCIYLKLHHIGDFWHVRGALCVDLLNRVLASLKQWTQPVIMIPGNHDQVRGEECVWSDRGECVGCEKRSVCGVIEGCV